MFRLLLLPAIALGVQDKWLFEEKFAGKPGKGWSWTREDASGWKIEKNALLLRALPGTLVEKANNAKNLLWREVPDYKAEEGGIAMEAVVENAPGAPGEQAGLVLYQDDDTFLRLVRENVDGKLRVVFGREMAAFSVAAAQRDEEGPSHRLRIRWEGRRVSAEVLRKGSAKWLVAGYCESPFTDPAKVKVALFSCGGPADAPRWARFSEFRIGHPDPVDQ